MAFYATVIVPTALAVIIEQKPCRKQTSKLKPAIACCLHAPFRIACISSELARKLGYKIIILLDDSDSDSNVGLICHRGSS